MANQAQTARQSDRSANAELTLAELMDPVALEARLVAARARRAEALARRRDEGADPAPLAVTRAPRPPMPSEGGDRALPPVPPATQPRIQNPAPKPTNPTQHAAPSPSPQPRPAPVLAAETPAIPRPAPKAAAKPIPATGAARPAIGTAPAVLLAILVGLIGGGAAVLLAPPAWRQHIADRIAPARNDAPSLPDTLPTVVTLAPQAPATDRMMEPSPAIAVGPRLTATIPSAPTRAEAESLPGHAGAVPAPPAPDTVAPAFGAALLVARAPTPAPGTAAMLPSFEPTPLAAAAPEPRQPEAAPRPVQTARLAPPAAAPTAPVPPAAKTGLAGATRVYVHFPPSAAATATAAVDALRAAGVAEARAIPAGVSVASTNIRFYHPEDRALAEELSRMIGDAQGGAAPNTRDFTDFRPQPLNGVVEIWLGGTTTSATPAAAQAGSTPRVARRSSSRPSGPTPADLVAQQARTEAVQQIVVRRAVERMLRQQLGD